MFRLAQLSLANRALIALVTVFASVFGVITMSSLKQELIPSIEFPRITVLTAMPGASPEVVDKQISGPLETALNGVEGHLRCRPGPGPQPDRQGHLQRQAHAARRRPAAGYCRQHQRFPHCLPGCVLGPDAQ